MPDSVLSAPSQDGPTQGEHRHVFALRWADMDMLQHVNNTVYFRAIEEARMQIFGPLRPLFAPGTGVVLARAECDFLKPMSWPGNIEIVHRLVRIGRSSLDCNIHICKQGDSDTLYARSRAVVVLSDLASGKSSPWPAALLEQLQKQFASATSQASV
ncbi:acyl-CoA thioester hydrolase [Advenella incenata]|jgi:acyl-CoA thioester hydrolase|uniref:Acyl-CoA thioester hydrolase n=1 Tax=Advenella incenata TaxID=267800 RepID=A0A4Q7VUQ8_9BURK|nr:thioesterase family protein [Advenella incenata]RZU00019.1 acyl-CoA thioester hydrolase [Advenella incenata]